MKNICALVVSLLALQLGNVVVADAQTWPVQVLAEDIIGAWIRAGDVDGDGDPDVFVQHGDTLHWYENQLPTGWTRHLIDPSFHNSAYSWVEEVDMDSDGDPDLLHATFVNPGTIAWNENRTNGKEWIRHVITTNGGGNGDFQRPLGDFDLDGDMDCAMPAFTAGQVFWYEGRDTGSVWIRHQIASLTSAIWISAADLDGDLDSDVAAGSFTSGGVYWYENQSPDTVWISHFLGLLPGSVTGEAIDIDQDGDVDIMTHNGSTLFYYDNPSWSPVIVASGFSGLMAGRPGDIDRDGDIDITYGGDGFGTVGDIGWIENLGGATGWKRHDIGPGSTLQRLPTGLTDIDRDGDTDITAFVFNVSSTVADAVWYDNPAIVSSAGSDKDELPLTSELFQNYPNPFNPTTTIGIGLPEQTMVTLSVFDLLGQKVTTLVEQHMGAGFHEVRLHADGMSSGLYFYELKTPGFRSVKQMAVLK